MQPFFERQALRFECTRCGRCCVAGDGYYVFVDGNEGEAIRSYLGLSRDWFRRRYLKRLPEGERVASWRDDGGCVFLDSAARCRVYPVRPMQCRSYPFWPEIVNRHRDWRRESRRCEGIGRGRTVPAARIRRFLDSDPEQWD